MQKLFNKNCLKKRGQKPLFLYLQKLSPYIILSSCLLLDYLLISIQLSLFPCNPAFIIQDKYFFSLFVDPQLVNPVKFALPFQFIFIENQPVSGKVILFLL